MKIKLFAVAVLGAFATACASTPPDDNSDMPIEPPVTDNGGGAVVDTTPTGPAEGSAEHFTQTAGDRVFYGLDRHDLTPEARTTLRRQAAWLASYPGARILIAGNCDERGTREYNLALGARRANAARDYLISQGVDASRISTTSYGKENPTCTQSNEQCWAINRNATTTLVGGYTN
ncbi:MAG: peptidoglycan-associated lipoprotein Pal [Alphaproteobacteria bacterium]|jgi:peptidoglycan-associated lipoprotein|uniref:peptidoglycan-associated lipoprotein Pal n=1 Tax=Maricaulis alexandrii TaxID=2570354 RepID=UPI0011089332|nr:peptidoglycan-associated lipoprotein Pal [Maricaulis alexandrii]MCR9267976.1 peptidoglycan-associated lipoprotein Pal [Alphaproteobacteria bacterium]